MIPMVLGAAALLGGYHFLRSRRKTAPGLMAPNKTAVHGWLMNYEHRPRELDLAAQVFGAEGLTVEAKQLAGKSAVVKQQAAVVPDLVARARMGDQNAMAQITCVRDNAAKGMPRAISTCKLIEEYCIRFPAEETARSDDPFAWPPANPQPSTPT